MKFLLSITLIIFLLLTSCSPNKIEQGEIVYTITYPYTDVTGYVSAILPEKMVLTFKGTKVKSMIKRGKLFKTVVISDEKDKSIEMQLDFGTEDFYSDLTASEVESLIASQPVYKIDAVSETDSLSGLSCKVYSVKNPVDTILHDNSKFSEDLFLSNAYWYSSYKNINGVPLVFDIERYGIVMHMEIESFVEREVKEDEFKRPSELKPLSFEEYENKVQDLFDILLDE